MISLRVSAQGFRLLSQILIKAAVLVMVPSNGDGSDEKSSDKKAYVRKSAGNKWSKEEVC